MPAGSTYTPIATTTVSTPVSSVSFNSFSGYTDLVLVMSAAGTANSFTTLRYNGDSGSNYSRTYLGGNGSVAYSGRNSSNSDIPVGDHVTTLGNTNIIVNFLNYSNSTTFKTALIRTNYPASFVEEAVGLWRSTAAITNFSLTNQSGNYIAGSTFTLYGIAAA